MLNFEQVFVNVGTKYELYLTLCAEDQNEVNPVRDAFEYSIYHHNDCNFFYTVYAREIGGTSVAVMDYDSREDALAFMAYIAEDSNSQIILERVIKNTNLAN